MALKLFNYANISYGKCKYVCPTKVIYITENQGGRVIVKAVKDVLIYVPENLFNCI